jgi:hypothetical protein
VINNLPDSKILEIYVTISKNYFSQQEITALNNWVSIYLDYAGCVFENQ